MGINQEGFELAGQTLQLGIAGSRVRSESSGAVVGVRNAANAAYARLKAANPVDAQDVVTRAYLEGTSDFRVTGEIDASQSALPSAATNNGEFFIVTTAGTINSVIYSVGQIYQSDGTNWNLQTVAENQSMKTDANYGIYLANREYVWDGTTWVLDASSEVGDDTIRFTIQHDSGTVTLLGLPINGVVKRIYIDITTAFNGVGAAVSFGITGDTDSFIVPSRIDLTNITDLQKFELFEYYATAGNLVVQVVPGTNAAIAGAANVIVEFSRA